MIGKITSVTIACLLVLVLVSAGGWFHVHQTLQESRKQLVASTLAPMGALLKENQSIINELQAEPFVEKDNGMLESYLIKIRREGAAKNAQMKQRLDQLAENNTTIVALIKAYSPHANAAAFTIEADKFRNYASAWRDRWNSVMELFMSGGNYPAAGASFPTGFPAAVEAEIAAAK